MIAVVDRKETRNRYPYFRCFVSCKHQHPLIDQGSSELNIIVGVREDDFENAVPFMKCLYTE